MIYTHENVDLDAAVCIWFLRKFPPFGVDISEITFCPVDWNEKELADMDKGLANKDVAIGLAYGIRGTPTPDGITSTFNTLLNKHKDKDIRSALDRLRRFVNAQYMNVDPVAAYGISGNARDVLAANTLSTVFQALKRVYREDSVTVDTMGPIFDGLLECGLDWLRTYKEADAACKHQGHGIAVLKDAKEAGTQLVLFEDFDIEVIIFQEGYNLGLSRSKKSDLQLDHPNIRRLVEAAGETEEWSLSKNGFTYSRGSRKVPAKTPSDITTGELYIAVLSAMDSRKKE